MKRSFRSLEEDEDVEDNSLKRSAVGAKQRSSAEAAGPAGRDAPVAARPRATLSVPSRDGPASGSAEASTAASKPASDADEESGAAEPAAEATAEATAKPAPKAAAAAAEPAAAPAEPSAKPADAAPSAGFNFSSLFGAKDFGSQPNIFFKSAEESSNLFQAARAASAEGDAAGSLCAPDVAADVPSVFSGEEGETVELSNFATVLYIIVDREVDGKKAPKFENRGEGVIRVLRDKESGAVRVIFRQSSTWKLLLNSPVSAMRGAQLVNNCYLRFLAYDFAKSEASADKSVQFSIFAVKFAHADKAAAALQLLEKAMDEKER